MAYKPKRWILRNPDVKLVDKLSKELNISQILASMLINRGICETKDALTYINPSFLDLENPFLLLDMEKGVKRLKNAVEKKEKILIYGDRDLDGISSVTVVYSTLKIFGLEPLWYIPQDQGYGLHKETIDKYAQLGVTLIITVDCGISNTEEISYIKSKGMDVIVTDHHETPADGKLPEDAVALIDPKRKDSLCTFNEIAGCAVAMKLLQGLLLSYDKFFDRELIFIDLETTGTHPVFNDICEIAALKTRNFVVLDKFHTFVNQSKDIPESATNLHGITREACDSSDTIEQVMPKLTDFIGRSIIITYNSEFCMGFLQQHARKHLGRELDNEIIDISNSAEEILTPETPQLSLLAEALDIPQPHTHHALEDAFLALKIFERLEKLKNKKMQFFLQDNLDIVSIGTIGDMMPLISENRIIVKSGMEAIKKTQKTGLRLMFEKILPDKYHTAKAISYNIVPLFNSCGRLKRAELAVQFLIAKDFVQAHQLFNEILDLNDARKELQQENVSIFLELLKEQCDVVKDNLLFIVGDNIEHGVTGIIASQIARQYYKPAILLITEKKGKATGTGRAIEGFNMYSAMESCRDLLDKFGGHSQAVGFTVPVENINELKNRMLVIARDTITQGMLEPTVDIEAKLTIPDINGKLLDDLAQIEPFGIENQNPVFVVEGIKVAKYSKMGVNNRHLRLIAEQNGTSINAVGWNMGELVDSILANTKYVDIAAQIEVSQFRNKEQIQLIITDMKSSI